MSMGLRAWPTEEDELMARHDELGHLEEIKNIREFWPHEAGDFTPWLFKNINLLGDAIGVELEEVETESSVGSFSVDIVCKDTDGHLVIVENQLERTDHDHLGKLLTYAAGKDATTVVWISKHLRDEHRAALDWLNEHTGDKINFFGIEIELWKIGDSPCAPKFNVISKPNDWTKAVRPELGELNDTQKLCFSFWTKFRNFMKESDGKVSPAVPSKYHWTNFAIGRGGFSLTALIRTRNDRAVIYLAIKGEAARAHYHLLLQQKEEIEKEIGTKLEWRNNPQHQEKSVRLWRECDARNEKQWDELHKWMFNHLEKFNAAFRSRIQRLDAAEWQPPNEKGSDSGD